MIALQFRVCVANAIPTAPIVFSMGNVDPARTDPWDMRGDPRLGLSAAAAARAFVTFRGSAQTVDRGPLLQTVLKVRRVNANADATVFLDLCVESETHFTVLLTSLTGVSRRVPLRKREAQVSDVAKFLHAEFGVEQEHVDFTDESGETLAGHLASFPNVGHGKNIGFTVVNRHEVQATLWEPPVREPEDCLQHPRDGGDIQPLVEDNGLSATDVAVADRKLLLFPYTATLADVRRKFAACFRLQDCVTVFNLQRSFEGNKFSRESHLVLTDLSQPGRPPLTIKSLKLTPLIVAVLNFSSKIRCRVVGTTPTGVATTSEKLMTVPVNGTVNEFVALVQRETDIPGCVLTICCPVTSTQAAVVLHRGCWDESKSALSGMAGVDSEQLVHVVLGDAAFFEVTAEYSLMVRWKGAESETARNGKPATFAQRSVFVTAHESISSLTHRLAAVTRVPAVAISELRFRINVAAQSVSVERPVDVQNRPVASIHPQLDNGDVIEILERHADVTFRRPPSASWPSGSLTTSTGATLTISGCPLSTRICDLIPSQPTLRSACDLWKRSSVVPIFVFGVRPNQSTSDRWDASKVVVCGDDLRPLAEFVRATTVDVDGPPPRDRVALPQVDIMVLCMRDHPAAVSAVGGTSD